MARHSAIRVFTVTFLLLLITACDNAPEPAESPPLRLVRTLEITPPDADFWREFPGVVEAAQKADQEAEAVRLAAEAEAKAEAERRAAEEPAEPVDQPEPVDPEPDPQAQADLDALALKLKIAGQG